MATKLLKLGLADGVIPEPEADAHCSHHIVVNAFI